MNKISDKKLLDIIENEGLDYTINDYLSPNSLENDKLNKLFNEIRSLYEKVNTELDDLRNKYW